ncbi:MAG TPA: hypothetical protein VGA32_06925 [Anaerolineales bacterium]
MTDPLGKITEGKDLLGKIRNFLAGFVGYVERENRREADKMLREDLARRYRDLWGRVSGLQRQLTAEAQLEWVDDLEGAAIKLQTFADRIQGAAYGYSGFFDAARVNEQELTQLYEYDLALLEGVDRISAAIDNVTASTGTDGMPAAVRHLVSLSQESIDAFNRREQVVLAP